MVPTPRALELRERVGQLVHDAEAVLRPTTTPDLARLERTFTLRTSEGFVENFGSPLIARVSEDAPGVRLRFVPKLTDDSAALRDGTVDLETGVVGRATTPELLGQSLFHDRFVGVVRRGHPLSRGRITAVRYASGRHIGISRRGSDRSRIDDALEALGLEREIVTSVGGFSTAIALARGSDLIATVPERHTGNLRAGMHGFPLPFAVPQLSVDAVAPATAGRSGASLAPSLRPGCLFGGERFRAVSALSADRGAGDGPIHLQWGRSLPRPGCAQWPSASLAIRVRSSSSASARFREIPPTSCLA